MPPSTASFPPFTKVSANTLPKTPKEALAPDRFSDPNPTPFPTHPGMKYFLDPKFFPTTSQHYFHDVSTLQHSSTNGSIKDTFRMHSSILEGGTCKSRSGIRKRKSLPWFLHLCEIPKERCPILQDTHKGPSETSHDVLAYPSLWLPASPW